MKHLRLIIIFSFVLFGCKENEKKEKKAIMNLPDEHAVIIHFKYGIEGLDSLFRLEDKLERVLEKSNVGEYDGHEIAGDYSDGYLYLYGKNADSIFSEIKPTLNSTSFMKDAVAQLRYGKAGSGSKEIIIKIE